MLQYFRKFLDTKAARIFFVLLIVPFVMWGVADVFRNAGGGTAVATVGSRTVEPPEFQEAFRQQIAQVTRMLGGKTEPTPAMRRGIAAQTLERLITQAAISEEVQRLGLVVPDEALRRAVFDMPVFHGRNGTFDRATLDTVLRQNNLYEARFLELMRTDLGIRQLIEAVTAGVVTPEALLRPVYAFQREQRVVELVELPFLAVPEPPAPTAEDLRRAYDNDPQRYAAPAYRRIKAVILSPDTIARDIPVDEADIKAFYESHRGEFGGPEKRSLQVLVSQDETAARTLAAQWVAGADWATMQQAATAAGAAAAQLDDIGPADLPGADLAEAAFKANKDTVGGPIQTPFGYQVFRVTAIRPGTEQPLDAVQDTIRLRIARERATDDIYRRANALEDAISAGTGLEDLPADLGIAGIAGTLDAKGETPEHEPAPIPGSPALRQAVIAAAFATPKNEPPRVTEGPDQSYFALVVEDETPATVRPFDQVEDRVREDWISDHRRRTQETVAARLLAAVKAGGALEDAALIAGVRMERSPPIGRSTPTEGIPAQLTQPIFALALNDATMIETPEGFFVVRLVDIDQPDPAADPAAASQIRTALDRSLAQDIEVTFATALRDRARPTVNRTLLESLAQ